MTIKDFDTKKVILEDQYSKASILMLFTPKSVLSIR